MASASSGTTNRVLSLWKGEQNVGVLSATDVQFIRKLKSWARQAGYRVIEAGQQKDEKEES